MFTGHGWRLILLAGWLAGAGLARGADALVDDAVASVAQLTNPSRLAQLTDEAFAAQLGPALGWLHVARRRDVAPESVIARAWRANGLEGSERGRLDRAALLRNLAKADGWELFNFTPSAQALVLGQPAVIQAGLHRGKLARAVFILSADAGTGGAGREFANLVLRAEDELPLPPARPPRTRLPHADERLAGRPPARRSGGRKSPAPSPKILLPPIEYDDALPVPDKG